MAQKTKSRVTKRSTISKESRGTLSDLVNVKQEEDKVIQKLADEEQVALISFIAPYVGVRISPIEESRVLISIPDEFGVEALVKTLKDEEIKRAYLLVNSPGGSMESSYKIARAFQMCLDEIVTFVPHVAASGGTLLSLIGKKIVMGPMSHITPLDVQLAYKGTTISAATFMRFFARASHWFETITQDEAPYPQKALADKLDPFIMEEWSGLIDTAVDYVKEILSLAGYKKDAEIAEQLVMAFPTHNYVITSQKAREIGLNVKDSSDFQKAWEVMRHWLSKYMFEQQVTHCIRYALPRSTIKTGENSGKKGA